MKPVSPVLPRRSIFSIAAEVVIAKGQPEYIPLPAIIDGGLVTTRWSLTWRERLIVFFAGSIFHQQRTFGGPMQPIKLLAVEPPLSEVAPSVALSI